MDTQNKRRFLAILPSDPIWLPFGGQFSNIAVVADQDRVMGLSQHLLDIAGDLQNEIDVLRYEMNRHQIEFQRSWGGHEHTIRARARAQEEGREYFETTDEELAWMEANGLYRRAQMDYTRLLNATTHQLASLRRQMNLRIIEDTIIQIGVATKTADGVVWSWPYEDVPPDPRQPDTLASWPDTVISWLAEDLQEVVQNQLKSPNLNGR